MGDTWNYNSLRLQELHPDTALGWEKTPELRMRALVKCFQEDCLGVPPLLHPALPGTGRKLCGKSLCVCSAHPHDPPGLPVIPSGREALLNRLFQKHSPQEVKPSKANENGSPELHKMLVLAQTFQNI